MKEPVPCPSPKAARQVRSTTRTWLVIESEGQTVRQSSTEASRRVRHAGLSRVYSELTALVAHANTVAAVASSSSPRLNSSENVTTCILHAVTEKQKARVTINVGLMLEKTNRFCIIASTSRCLGIIFSGWSCALAWTSMTLSPNQKKSFWPLRLWILHRWPLWIFNSTFPESFLCTALCSIRNDFQEIIFHSVHPHLNPL